MGSILYISYDGLTDPLGQSQVLPYLIGLSKKGYSITILSAEKKQQLNNYHVIVSNSLREHNIKWEYILYTKFPPVLSTVNDIKRIYGIAKKLAAHNKVDIVHCRSYISSLIGLKLKKKYGIKFIFDMRGFWADERVDGKIWNLKNPVFKLIYNFFKKKEIDFLRNADYTVSLTEKAKKEIQEKREFIESKPEIKIIPCCADLNLFRNAYNMSEIKKGPGINHSDFVLTYLGSIGTWYMLDEMMDFFKVLLSNKPHSKFLFITTESAESINKSAAAKDIPYEKIIIKSANRKEVPLYLSITDVSIFFIKPSYSKIASSPTKMGELMGMGIPIITNSGIGDVDDILQKTNAGISIKYFNDEEYLRAVMQIDRLCQIPKENIRQEAEKYFSLNTGIEKYDEVYKSVLNKNG